MPAFPIFLRLFLALQIPLSGYAIDSGVAPLVRVAVLPAQMAGCWSGLPRVSCCRWFASLFFRSTFSPFYRLCRWHFDVLLRCCRFLSLTVAPAVSCFPRSIPQLKVFKPTAVCLFFSL